LGLDARPEEVLTSALATAAMLEAEGGAGAEAFVIGGPGIREALTGVGIRVIGGEPHRADLVVVGWDPAADYGKLRTACLLVERGARLVATNPDASFPAADGLWPGAGALLAVITTTTNATPVVVGKPFAPMFDEARRRTEAARPLMVGDRLDTDIAGASNAGFDSALVLTGVSSTADLPSAPALPTYVAPDVGALLQPGTPARIRVASRRDAPRVTSLLRSAGLEPDGSDAWPTRTIILEPDDGASPLATATAAVEAAGGSNYLRSVAVRADLRHRGLGLLAAAAAVRAGDPMAPTYVATETAASLFVRLGFEPVGGHDLPEGIRELIEGQGCVDPALLRRGPTHLPSPRTEPS
jgi:ribonucleotide monophosphatase NagD (HAD superfamily)/N-acetylglutamate synthase-like GNAT family acetyltransferase